MAKTAGNAPHTVEELTQRVTDLEAVLEEGKHLAYQIVSEGKFAGKPELIKQANQFIGSILEQKKKSK